MDLMAFCIFLLTVVVCSILVYVISVYGTKEVTFEENLKASQILGTTNKKKAETKKKSKKVQKSETESVSFQLVQFSEKSILYVPHFYKSIFWA